MGNPQPEFHIPPPPTDSGSPADIPPPEPAFENIPPPAPEGEQHEADVLKRRKRFSWKQFGGDGFLISVAFHVVLLLLGLFYVIQKYKEPKKPEPDVFATGAGGGASGDKAKQFEHRMQRKISTPLKTPSRIVSKAANSSVALPSTPSVSTASFASGLATGGMSKGSGGGSGGGEGTGLGIGKGGGRNFVSLFGSKNFGAPGLVGTFYDLKINQQKKGTGLQVANSPEFRDAIARFIRSDWAPDQLDRKYYRCATELVSSMFMIPQIHTSIAPKSFEADANVGLENWMVVYRGRVKAPFSGEFRFVGYMADCIAVRFNRKLALVSEHASFPLKGLKKYPELYRANIGGSADIIRAGDWIKVDKGGTYDIEVALVDAIPGTFRCFLMYEKKGDNYAGDGASKAYPIFRMTDDPPPPLKGGQAFPANNPAGEIFRAVPVPRARVR